MTHEFKELILKGIQWQEQGIAMVLATVVALEGSSYRRPGVRMLMNAHGEWIGAVSGGCVEKEVYHQAQQVFNTGQACLMSYDGRFRLGCEGTIYIVLEPFSVESAFAKAFTSLLEDRIPFSCTTYYDLASCNENPSKKIGTLVHFGEEIFGFDPSFQEISKDQALFEQQFMPIFQLYIFGAEHDAVALSKMANNVGWDVHIIAPPDEQKTITYFTGASSLRTPTFETLDTSGIDADTAVVLMTHSFHKDIQYLMALRDTQPLYFGLLGPPHRRERVFSEFLERFPNTEPEFLEKIHGPAGINIGAENASEIAISIIAEILTVLRQQEPMSLREKQGAIHE